MTCAVFYHIYLGGGVQPARFDNCLRIAAEQIDALNCSGLSAQWEKGLFGVSGPVAEFAAVAAITPEKCEVVHHQSGVGELPTMLLMQNWCRANPGRAVFYFHTKGAIHNGSPPYESWRKCMEKYCLWGWRDCVADLERGLESVGVHWLTPRQYPFIGKVPYWGGNFWWATSDFINTLPAIDPIANRYEAEVWLGKGPKPPRVRDYNPHFPMSGC